MVKETENKTEDTKKENDIFFSSKEINNPNEAIVMGYEQFQIVKAGLKDINTDIKSKYAEDEDITLLIHKIEELNTQLKPLKDELKTRKEEFRVANLPLFEDKKKLENSRNRINHNILLAVAKKQELKDDSPIIIMDGNKQKRIIVNLKPTLKKAKLD